jgi:hypothetical protein
MQSVHSLHSSLHLPFALLPSPLSFETQHITTKRTKRNTLTLRLRLNQTQTPNQLWRFDWKGLEDKQEEVRGLAIRIRDAARELEVECEEKGWDAPGVIGCGVRDPEEASRIFSPYSFYS